MKPFLSKGLTTAKPMLTDEEARARYGSHAVVSRTRQFTLVHLDNPTLEIVTARTREFDPERFFHPDCPLCAVQRAQRLVVFDDYDDFEEILIE